MKDYKFDQIRKTVEYALAKGWIRKGPLISAGLIHQAINNKHDKRRKEYVPPK